MDDTTKRKPSGDDEPGTSKRDEGGHGGEGGYGGGSTGFDEAPEQGLGEPMSDEEIEEQPRGA